VGVVCSVELRRLRAGISAPVARGAWRQIARTKRFVPLLLLAGALMAGCATTGQNLSQNPIPKQVAHSTARTYAPRIHAAAKPAKPIPLPDAALLKRQPPPDCELKTQPAGNPSEVKVMTLDYERNCYKQVEGIVRTRLDTLQDAVGETVKAVKDGESESVGSVRK
jgi:hypothetical protein